MTRVNLPGIARATKTLANGTKRTYLYAWRGGPLLKAPDGTPLTERDPQLHVAYAEAHMARKQRPDGNLGKLVQLFRESSEFAALSDRTRKEYRRYLDMIDKKFGKMPLAVVEDPRTRGDFKEWSDSMADRPRVSL